MGQVLRTLLRQVIEERGFSLADVSRRIGKSRSFLPKALDPENTTSLRADQIPQILATIQLPLVQFYRRYLAELSSTPQAPVSDADSSVLFGALLPTPLPTMPPELAEVVEDEHLAPLRTERLDVLPAWLLRLDTLRMNDPNHAYLGALREISRTYDSVKLVRSDWRRRGALILALGGFASVARSTGNAPLAALTLKHAFRLLGSAHGGIIAGDLLWRSGIICIDHGLLSVGIAMVERSAMHYRTFPGPESAWAESRSFVSLGSFYAMRGDFDAAERAYRHVIREPASGDLLRAFAIVNCAWLYDRLERPTDAISLLESVEEFVASMPKRPRLETRWARARALASLRRFAEAQAIYRELVGPIEVIGEPVDPILLCADFAAAVKASERSQMLAAAFSAAWRAHERLGAIPIAAAASATLLAALQEAATTLNEISELRASLTQTLSRN